MSPLFMDTECEPNTPGSLSAEDSNSHTGGSEREGEEPQHLKKTGTKRREKNRDAARKSRRKQTERADELHEELQSLERSNSVLHKEIASLKKEFQLYTTALKRHESYCCLRTSASSSSVSPSVSTSADSQSASSPATRPLDDSGSNLLAAPSISTSLNSSLGLQAHDCVENAPLPPSATLASSSGSSSHVFISSPSSQTTVPYSCSYSTLPHPHSLFSEGHLITSRPINITPVSTNPVPNPPPSIAQHPSVQHALHDPSSLSADICFSAVQSDTLDAFPMKQASFGTCSTNGMSLYSHVTKENVGLAQEACMNIGLYSGNPNNSSSLLPPILQDSTPQSLVVSPQTLSGSFCGLKPNCNQQIAPNQSSLLSLLTIPSPLNIPQPASSTFDELISQSPSPLPPLGDASGDLSLSELLEGNDWIFTGNNNL